MSQAGSNRLPVSGIQIQGNALAESLTAQWLLHIDPPREAPFGELPETIRFWAANGQFPALDNREAVDAFSLREQVEYAFALMEASRYCSFSRSAFAGKVFPLLDAVCRNMLDHFQGYDNRLAIWEQCAIHVLIPEWAAWGYALGQSCETIEEAEKWLKTLRLPFADGDALPEPAGMAEGWLKAIFPWGICGIDSPNWAEGMRKYESVSSIGVREPSLTPESLALAAARLGLGDDAADWLAQSVAKIETGQAQRSYSMVTAFQEMLLQSYPVRCSDLPDLKAPHPYGEWAAERIRQLRHDVPYGSLSGGIIRVCPAVPRDWSGSFKLNAAGGFSVECAFAGGRPLWIEIVSGLGRECVLANPWTHDVLLEKEGETLTLPLSRTFRWNTRPGERYVLRDRGATHRYSAEEDPAQWRLGGKRQLERILWPNGNPGATDFSPILKRAQQRDRYILHEFELAVSHDRRISMLISMPNAAAAIVPAVVALHGHEDKWGKADEGSFAPGHIDDFCHYFAERNYSVIYPPTMDHRLTCTGGETLFGWWVRDILQCMDFAVGSREIGPCRIDSNRLGVVGLSAGAHLAVLVTALEPRIRACVSAGVFTPLSHVMFGLRVPPGCSCGFDFQAAPSFDTADQFGLCAPRPLMVQIGRKDTAIYPGAEPSEKLRLQHYYDWQRRPCDQDDFAAEYRQLQRIYNASGAGERLVLHKHDQGHALDNESAFQWIDTWLNRAEKR